jgi:hypothetical protein
MPKIIVARPHTMLGRTCNCSKMSGTGMGSVLLHGSAGVAGTFTSASPSPGNLNQMLGSGLGKTISAKLDKLRVVSKKKPENIKFSI